MANYVSVMTEVMHLYSAVRDYPVVLNIDRACARAPR